jgi:hypothetical protein
MIRPIPRRDERPSRFYSDQWARRDWLLFLIGSAIAVVLFTIGMENL